MKKITDLINEAAGDLQKISSSELHRRVRAAEAHPSKLSADHKKTADQARKELVRREREDDEKGHYIHQLTSTEHLSKIVTGKIDPHYLAKKELANRGLDSSGKWVGFDKAKEHHFGSDKKNLKEEALNELSTDTLKSYREKARKAGQNHKRIADRADVRYGQSGFGDAGYYAGKVDYHSDMENKRKTGAINATKKIKAKEKALKESDQLDELSTKTLSNYIKKASSDSANHAHHAASVDTWDQSVAHMTKQFKRRDGVEKAVDKIVAKKKSLKENDLISVKDARKKLFDHENQDGDQATVRYNHGGKQKKFTGSVRDVRTHLFNLPQHDEKIVSHVHVHESTSLDESKIIHNDQHIGHVEKQTKLVWIKPTNGKKVATKQRKKTNYTAIHTDGARFTAGSKEDAVSNMKYYHDAHHTKKLDEVSKETLTSYADKATDKLADSAYRMGGSSTLQNRNYHEKKADNRRTGLKRAIKKLADKQVDESADQLDEVSKETLGSYVTKASDAKGHKKLSTKKVDNRYVGVKKASDKLEDMEQKQKLDEISKKTLGSYVHQASVEQGKAIAAGDNAIGRMNIHPSMDNPVANKHYDRAEKRNRGVKKALDRLTKDGDK